MTNPSGARILAASVLLAGCVASTAASGAESVLRATMHADLRTLDPIWTTQTMASIHGFMIYDTLLAPDDKLDPQPQMVEGWSVSEDRTVYTFTLRDGLRFHDGTPVTTRDVLPSIRRWGARRNAAKQLMAFTRSIEAADARTFVWTLKQPYSLIIDTLAHNQAFVMREKEALTDPFQQVTEAIGSGPFRFDRAAWSPGAKAVYTRFRDYVPRQEPPSGHAGGKVVKVDRVEFIWIPDPSTQQSALVAGEIDYLEAPQLDFLPILEAMPEIKLEKHPAQGRIGVIQLNHLHPPFNNVKARQAMYHLVNMQDFLDTLVADKRLQHPCYSYLGCNVPMETDAGSEVYRAPKDYAKAAQLFKEAGYKGEPITILHATDHPNFNPAHLILVQHMRRAGLAIDAHAMDWGSVVTRRAKKEPPAQGGWNIYITGTSVLNNSSPVTHFALSAACDKAGFGWPCDARMEELRTAWSLAPDLATRKQLAVDISRRAYEIVPYLPFSQWSSPAAYRQDRLTGVISVPTMPPMWNIARKP